MSSDYYNTDQAVPYRNQDLPVLNKICFRVIKPGLQISCQFSDKIIDNFVLFLHENVYSWISLE